MRILATLVAAALLFAPTAADAITHGVVVGDVTDSSALLWARAGEDGMLNVRLSGGPHKRLDPVAADPGRDYTARVAIDGLAPDAEYSYRARFDHGAAVTGSFRTAPAAKR